MANIPQRVSDRLVAGIKKFQPILAAAQAHDANESDTVIMITDMLSEVFGYDKYTEITTEKCIRGTFCDLSIKVNEVTQSIIEAKAINQELKEGYVKQAVDYAVNGPVDWVVLTNGVLWCIYKVIFSKPVDHELVIEINFPTLNYHTAADLDALFLFSRESWGKSALSDFYDKKQAMSRFSIGALLLSDPILSIMKRELKRLSPDVKIETEQIRAVLEQEVLKREIVEGDKADAAAKRIARAASKALRNKTGKDPVGEVVSSDVQKPPDTTSPNSPPPVLQ